MNPVPNYIGSGAASRFSVILSGAASEAAQSKDPLPAWVAARGFGRHPTEAAYVAGPGETPSMTTRWARRSGSFPGSVVSVLASIQGNVDDQAARLPASKPSEKMNPAAEEALEMSNSTTVSESIATK